MFVPFHVVQPVRERFFTDKYGLMICTNAFFGNAFVSQARGILQTFVDSRSFISAMSAEVAVSYLNQNGTQAVVRTRFHVTDRKYCLTVLW